MEGHIWTHLDSAVLINDNGEWPLFRSTLGRAKRLTDKPLVTKGMCWMVKRRLKDAGLPVRLSPRSFRVAWITDLLSQGVPLDDMEFLDHYISKYND